MICKQLIKADIARLKVEMRALELGIICSRPVIEGTRYDVILDTGGKLYRAQVKYDDGRATKCTGVVQVNLRKEIRKEKNHPYTDSEIDVLLVYVPKIDKICCFGPEIFHQKLSLSIRIAPAKNGQMKLCLPAENFFW
jgi:hypothetical protein